MNQCVFYGYSSNGNESENTKGSIAALLDEGPRLIDDICSPMEQTPPGADKTPKTPIRVADLAAAVDWVIGIERNYSTPSQGQTCIIYLCWCY